MSRVIAQPTSVGPSAATDRRDAGAQRVRSDALLKGGRRLIIEHGGARYTLLLTRNDKLILTK